MQDYAHESDIRYKGVVEKKRLALLAQMRQLERVRHISLLDKVAHKALSHGDTGHRWSSRLKQQQGIIPMLYMSFGK